MGLEGRVALVTGANRSIGKSLSLALARRGASVAVHFHSKSDDANAVVEEIRSAGGAAFAFRADVSNRGEVEEMIIRCREDLGPVDILVNNARQLVKGRSFIELNWEDDYAPHVEVMLKGTFNCCQAAIPAMIERGSGRIINILSTALGEKRARTNSYGSIKSALLYFSQTLAVEMGPHGITVNMVSPGLTTTERPILHSGGYQREYIDQTPVGRMGVPEDVAEAVVFFCGEETSFITGVNMAVSGGKVMF
ncbi:MAG: SDR family oxidoreductase [Nitrospinota bacterium]|jgi:NAD(P)-dependent dehydrogenase (short-subunit alcohol dehydrogenase family)|nr:SDR family oxidoreductase [Nitrospinota bacterium]